jgi:putative intracellular protease/amidase
MRNTTRNLLPILIILFTSHFVANSTYGAPNSPVYSEDKIPAYVKRFNRKNPIIAIVAENDFTEITDYVVPYGVLAESGVAEVFALAVKAEPIQMFPAPFMIEPQETIRGFDTLYPEGADYVMVPAVHFSDNPELLAWIKSQARKGATIVGICDGVWVLANAGLLEGRKSVGHWYSFTKLSEKFDSSEWIKDKRYIADGNIITTTGVTASIPVSLALVEAIAGSERATIVALQMGAKDWSSKHNSDYFQLSARHMIRAAVNWLSFWSHDDIAIRVEDGVDEIALAILSDSYSRTYRSNAFPYSDNKSKVVSKRGLTVIINKSKSFNLELYIPDKVPPLELVDFALKNISKLYGSGTSDFVALQLEYGNEEVSSDLSAKGL